MRMHIQDTLVHYQKVPADQTTAVGCPLQARISKDSTGTLNTAAFSACMQFGMHDYLLADNQLVPWHEITIKLESVVYCREGE